MSEQLQIKVLSKSGIAIDLAIAIGIAISVSATRRLLLLFRAFLDILHNPI